MTVSWTHHEASGHSSVYSAFREVLGTGVRGKHRFVCCCIVGHLLQESWWREIAPLLHSSEERTDHTIDISNAFSHHRRRTVNSKVRRRTSTRHKAQADNRYYSPFWFCHRPIWLPNVWRYWLQLGNLQLHPAFRSWLRLCLTLSCEDSDAMSKRKQRGINRSTTTEDWVVLSSQKDVQSIRSVDRSWFSWVFLIMTRSFMVQKMQ